MRQVFAIICALTGGYLLWQGFRFGRVLLIIEDKQFDATMLTIAGVMAAVGLALMFVAWRLFRAPPGPPPAGPIQ